MTSDPRDTYDSLWDDAWHEELESPGASYRTRRRLFLKLVDTVYTPGASILDVGCGNGSLLADVARRHPDVGAMTGVDVAESAVNHARERLPQAAFFTSDPQVDSLPVQAVDLVTSCEVLEHVPDYAAVLRNMAEAVKLGGHVIISVPHSMRFWGPHDEAVHHVRRFEAKALRAAVEDAGLDVVRLFTWGSGLYRIYYGLVLNHVAPAATAGRKSALSRALHTLLFRLLHVDDMLPDTGHGRMLFLVARRPR
jgi:2-polyprenyl-3-methyl-5-hydroxy-6-metoxy-1,4-benzoquinol methylase